MPVTARSGRRARALLLRLLLVAGSCLLVLGGLEATLRARPTLLGVAFANGALSRYSTRAGGIYYHDANLRMNFMIPSHTALMYANGYVWHHRTDALGFRNDALRVPADVVVLGDSLVYGQGVEVEDTVAVQLERETGLRVANLGRQGDCAFQEAYLLTAYAPIFRPRYVVHIFTPNDIMDAYVYLSDQAMAEFIATPVERIAYPERQDVAVALRAREQKLRRTGWWRRAEESSYVAKMYRWLLYTFGPRQFAFVTPAWAAHGPRHLDSPDPAIDPKALGWRYTEHALVYMRHVAETHHARFLMAPVATDAQLAILRALAARHGIELVDLGPAMADGWLLPNDGHFSPLGARLVAEAIARHLDARPAPSRRLASGETRR